MALLINTKKPPPCLICSEPIQQLDIVTNLLDNRFVGY